MAVSRNVIMTCSDNYDIVRQESVYLILASLETAWELLTRAVLVWKDKEC